MKKDCFPGVWDSSVSGHLDRGESYDACAIRELYEEIGLRVSQVPERLFKVDACPQTGQEHVWVYRCEAEGPFVLSPDEIERGDWVARETVTRWTIQRPEDFAGGFVLIWQKLCQTGL